MVSQNHDNQSQYMIHFSQQCNILEDQMGQNCVLETTILLQLVQYVCSTKIEGKLTRAVSSKWNDCNINNDKTRSNKNLGSVCTQVFIINIIYRKCFENLFITLILITGGFKQGYRLLDLRTIRAISLQNQGSFCRTRGVLGLSSAECSLK